MSLQAHKTVVGAFVVLGIALFTAGLVVLGGGRFFSESLKYVLYFDGSVSGLSIGAPVVFRGVPMGSVTRISLVANARDSNVTIPVTISIDDKSFIRASGAQLSEEAQSEIIQRMVERGLRARLQLSSLITGQYRVELDFFPNTPMNFRSSNPDSEIPTVPSPIDTMQKALARIPIDQIMDSVSAIIANLNDALGDGKLKEGIAAFTAAFDEMKSLFASSEVRKALDGAAGEIKGAASSVRKELPAAIAAFRETMNSFTRAAEQFRKIGNTADAIISRDSPTMNDIRRALADVAQAARSLRNFVDMLERNPEALIKGRQGTR